MNTVTFRANCTQLEHSQNWLVDCLRCGAEIGTMNTEMLRQAIWKTAHRGGVLCPECRAKSCKGCGIAMSDMNATTDELLKGFCLLCDVEMGLGIWSCCSLCGERLEGGYSVPSEIVMGHCLRCEIDGKGKQPACLVSHISSPEKLTARRIYVAQERANEIFSEGDTNICVECGSLWKPRFIDRCENCGSVVSRPIKRTPWLAHLGESTTLKKENGNGEGDA